MRIRPLLLTLPILLISGCSPTLHSDARSEPAPEPPTEGGSAELPERRPASPDIPADSAEAASACMGVSYEGVCTGDIIRYCDGEELIELDCSVYDMTCGWVEAQSVFYCVERAAPRPDSSLPDAAVPDAEVPDADTPDAAPPGGPRPGDGVIWLDWPEQHSGTHSTWGPVLTDIDRRLPSSYGRTYYDSDKVTHGHETTHGINSHLRNYLREGSVRVNGFYNLEGRAILIPEPDFRKSQIAPFVPRSLRQSRYRLYLEGSRAWDDRPLYIMDEWVSYINGGAVGVDRVRRGLWREGWRDAVMGPLEFTVYGIALAMAVEHHAPEYFARETQFREFTAFSIRRAMEVFQAGRDMEEFRWERQETYLNTLQTSPDAEALREFVRRTYGASFAAETLGI